MIRNLLFIMVLLLPYSLYPNQNVDIDVKTILKELQTNFNEIKDYTVKIHAEIDMKEINIPPMDVKVYFKQPDKFHMESDGFVMLPREGIFVNPDKFNDENFYMSLLGKETINGSETYKIELVPRKEDIMIRKLYLWIDFKNWTISKMNTVSLQNQSSQFIFEYEKIKNKYWMPVKIVADIDISGFKGLGHSMRMQQESNTGDSHGKKKKGKLVIEFSKYKINSNLADKIFEQN